MMDWYPIFFREMLLFKQKLLKFGYVFSSVMFPMIYLLAFGFGLGRRVDIDGGNYIEFLLPGIVAMTSMLNSYNLVSNSLSMGRLYYKSFQVIVQSPVSSTSIMVGIVLSGMVRGLTSAIVIMLAGVVIFGIFPLSLFSFIGLLLNVIFFSCMGVVVGMFIKSTEDNAIYTNFFIMPMAFFSGTFFPIDGLPPIVKGIIMFLPLSYTNILMRSECLNSKAILSILVLTIFSVAMFWYGARLIRNYSE